MINNNKTIMKLMVMTIKEMNLQYGIRSTLAGKMMQNNTIISYVMKSFHNENNKSVHLRTFSIG